MISTSENVRLCDMDKSTAENHERNWVKKITLNKAIKNEENGND